ncbi:hypothetical protein KC19_2G258300 [Ceratodon purpureus]|uniref:Uncharacterized protein n=1 Tax=Ceratodon purpureus TaxID=3225 RepID=A0A8T0J0I9_CERPU|nr:hypothetical protein KC19_2G258300 [Ceratodon purpureus]
MLSMIFNYVFTWRFFRAGYSLGSIGVGPPLIEIPDIRCCWLERRCLLHSCKCESWFERVIYMFLLSATLSVEVMARLEFEDKVCGVMRVFSWTFSWRSGNSQVEIL